MELLFILGLTNWIVTVILVESEIFKPLREWLDMRADNARQWTEGGGDDVTRRDRWAEVAWRKTGYLIHCYLCSGTWIGLALAAAVPWRPVGAGLAGWAIAGLAIKAAGHLILEVSHRLTRQPA